MASWIVVILALSLIVTALLMIIKGERDREKKRLAAVASIEKIQSDIEAIIDIFEKIEVIECNPGCGKSATPHDTNYIMEVE